MADWFGNQKHKDIVNGPHTGTGYSGKFMIQPKVVSRKADGTVIKKGQKKNG